MIIHKWISSDGSELVPTTDVKVNLTLPIMCAYNDPEIQSKSHILKATVVTSLKRAAIVENRLCASVYAAQTNQN
jgi:hypothetical protein